MPDVRPFRALRFSLPRTGNPALVVAPPLDTAGPEALESLRAQSPHNVANLLAPADGPAEAAEQLRRWRKQGVVQRDGEPALYAYEQTWASPGGRRTRRGFFGLLRLDQRRRKVLLPFRPVAVGQARERLRTFRTNLSPVLALYDDATGEVDGTLTAARSAFPDVALTDAEGIEHRLFPVTDPFALQRVAALLEHRTVLVGDGQDDYEAALEIQHERTPTSAEPNGGDSPWDYVLTYFSNSADGALAVRAYHLVIGGLPGFEFGPVVKQLETYFQLDPVRSIRNVQRILERTEAAGRHGTAFAILGGGGVGRRSGFIARLDTRAVRERLESLGGSPRYRGLDVAVLNELILKDLLGCAIGLDGSALGVDYVDDPLVAMARGRSKDAQLVILRNPPPISALYAVCQEGGKVPRPIARFYPHCMSGLVFNDLRRF